MKSGGNNQVLRNAAPPCIHELFELQAAKQPDKDALLYGHEHMTYHELNHRANQLARRLQRLGARTEVLVGIRLETPFDAATAALAVLKAGAAFISFSADQPLARMEEMMDDARPHFIICRTEIEIPRNASERLDLDADKLSIARESGENVLSGVTQDDAAFVRYTSGSTGRPAGVVNIHRSLTARIVLGHLPDIQEGDICALKLSSRLFIPLALGVPVVVMGPDDKRDVKQFVQTMLRHGVTSISLVPSHLRQVLSLNASILSRLTMLRVVTVGGEPLAPDLIRSFYDVWPHAKLINVYNSTEMGSAAAMRIATSDSDWRCIGPPLPNTRIYVLDENLKPAPKGSAGSIYVASAHLAREYINNPDLTAARFLSNPFDDRTSGGRIFRTGDVGRYTEKAEIEFLGREDDQVKIRGFRVELLEIERVLRSADGTSDACVSAIRSGDDTRLIAYIECAQGSTPNIKDLRQHLDLCLPRYMMPHTFMFLDRLPRTTEGKVDRRALPPPDRNRPSLTRIYTAPRNAIETKLAEIWSHILDVTPIGIHDDFMELGGDSLTAVRLMLRVCDDIGVEVPVTKIAPGTTVAEMASYISSLLLESASGQNTTA